MGEPLPHHRLPLLTEVVADAEPVSLPLPVLTETAPATVLPARPVPLSLPVLTEPVAVPGDTPSVHGVPGPVPAVGPVPSPVPVPEVDEARVVDTVLQGLQPRIDLMFEYRLRETLGPVLARLTDSLVHEVRQDLAQTLRDVVARAVAQEVSRRRPR